MAKFILSCLLAADSCEIKGLFQRDLQSFVLSCWVVSDAAQISDCICSEFLGASFGRCILGMQLLRTVIATDSDAMDCNSHLQ